MNLRLEAYAIADVESIITPALLIYPEVVDANIEATLRMAGGDPNRWRPHIKTTKTAAVLAQMMRHRIVNFKCSTTLELRMACSAGAADVLLAFPVVGANAARTLEIAREFPQTRVSVLVENALQAAIWRRTEIGIFVDVNPGMNRTGIAPERTVEILELARIAGRQFRGLHYYDGHMSAYSGADLENHAYAGYDQLMSLVDALAREGIAIAEVITSGTPATPYGLSYGGFREQAFVHRISPGTLVFNDLSSLKQLAGHGYAPAALVLTTVVSQPAADLITCDAGHKSVSADSGVPTCAVLGHPELTPSNPSEEHLPIRVAPGARVPTIGEKLYLLPKHVCPSVNNFDEALLVVSGRVQSLTTIGARGHESPFAGTRAGVLAIR